MDGDGWVSIKENRNNYPTLGFIGTEEMLNAFISYLGNPNYYHCKYIERNTNTYIIHYYAENAITILNNLYKDAFLYMDRKYQKYRQGLRWRRKINTSVNVKKDCVRLKARTTTLIERRGTFLHGASPVVSCA